MLASSSITKIFVVTRHESRVWEPCVIFDADKNSFWIFRARPGNLILPLITIGASLNVKCETQFLSAIR